MEVLPDGEINYYELEQFSSVYLEDSFVSNLTIGLQRIEVTLEVVLRECHPNYSTPLCGEQYCYRSGRIVFANYSEVSLKNISSLPCLDSSDSVDYGNVDYFRKVGSEFVLGGDWGDLAIQNGTVDLEVY